MKYSKKGLEKRKAERACLPEFFKKHIEIAKTKCCEECGNKLKGDVSEIAHILPKSYFKSVMCDDLNVLYLCGMYSEKQCHSNYDNWSVEKVKEMNIFLKVEKVFKDLKIILTETLNYKHYDRWQI
jgi:hypothetical protein